MSTPPPSPWRGPIEELEWATTLPARVFTPGSRPHMHGYEIYGDLARHYRFSDLVFTALRGQPPSDAQSELFDATLSFLGPTSVSEAPAHAALLARACGAEIASVVSVGAITLSEDTSELVERHAELAGWLADPVGPLPEAYRDHAATDRDAVTELRARSRASGVAVPILEHEPTRFGALFGCCYACEFTNLEQWHAIVVAARLPFVLTEALFHPRGDRRRYPIDLPPFRYRPEDSP